MREEISLLNKQTFTSI